MFKVEVIADNTNTWAGNGLRFETERDAVAYALNLEDRWTLVRKWRVVPVVPETEKGEVTVWKP